jgi:3-dehydroquinate synthase
VSETNVAPLYLEKVRSELVKAGIETADYVFEAGERSKGIEAVAAMWNTMAEAGFTRTDIVVGLGGGVTTDMAGFAAATFLRGINVIQVPTSLLAMVDASIGGKTGIDIPMGKNQVGAFWQPSLVVEDTSFLKTLPDEVFTEGMGEVTKHAFIMDPVLLEKLEKANGNIRDDEDLLEEIVAMNVADKASVVKEDENDNGRRQILNFGHTVGHVIERDSGFTKPHGICVAKGMGLIMDACVRAGTLSSDDAKRMKDLLTLYGLPVSDDITPEAIVKGAMNDKKKRGGLISVILVNEIGRAEIKKMTPEEFLGFLSK